MVERFVYTEDAAGSSPAPPTKQGSDCGAFGDICFSSKYYIASSDIASALADHESGLPRFASLAAIVLTIVYTTVLTIPSD